MRLRRPHHSNPGKQRFKWWGQVHLVVCNHLTIWRGKKNLPLSIEEIEGYEWLDFPGIASPDVRTQDFVIVLARLQESSGTRGQRGLYGYPGEVTRVPREDLRRKTGLTRTPRDSTI